ncbi:MAG: class I tRNA ligase family protein, partial [Candidatus Parcubacteria bacterium]|nr:class I tRNA ligase family protein [Candidatus Parcubacteria bacterium]
MSDKSTFAKQEEEILKFWQDNKIFEQSVQKDAPRGEYVFYDGPPFATGLPHYGHILSSVIKDVVPRYWTMKGYSVPRRWGWDCHGLPIENIVEKELKISGKKQIETIGIDKFNETCRSKVLTYTQEWKKMVDRIGRWIDFDNSYKTMDATYMESVWWALKTVWDKGLIYEGRKVLMYCPRCETPVSKAEVAMDDSYKDITEESVTVKFKVKDPQKHDLPSNTYILAWTTTPWTLPANVALAVGKEMIYVLVKQNDQHYLLAHELVDKIITGDYTEENKFTGADLIGLEYEPLIDIPALTKTGKPAWYVTDADFVSTEEGTGVVHTAVVYGEEDYNLGLKKDLPVVPLLDEKGIFNAEAPDLIRGLYFKDSEKVIKDYLETNGLLFSKQSYTHSYPHCWRCDTQLFYNAISAWFIDIQKIKPRLIKLNEKINWYPDNIKHSRFLNILETAPDWNISRNRYWATPLPFWKCDNPDCQEKVCIGSFAELKAKAVNFSEVY